MIECFKTVDGVTARVDDPEPGCWINVVDPDEDERSWLVSTVGVQPEFLRSALDDEESSHIDYDDDTNQSLVIFDCPYVEDLADKEDPSTTQYDTHPLSILFLREQDLVVTVSLRENASVVLYATSKLRLVNTHSPARLFLQLVLNVTQKYLQYLRNIDRAFNKTERILRETLRNKEVIKMLGFEKSLVYFSTSLKSDEATLNRIASGRVLRLTEDDRELLDDVLIELRQAIEMTTIYTNILNGTMNAFSSVISNNLNDVMYRLTVITIVLAVPTIVFSFYGMNVDGLPGISWWFLPLIISIVLVLISIPFFWRARKTK